MNITQERPSLLDAPVEQTLFFNKWLAVEIGDRQAIVLTAIARDSLLKDLPPEGTMFTDSSHYQLLLSSGLSRRTISRNLKKLQILGLVEKANRDRLEAEKILRSKHPSLSSWPFDKQCEWCGTKTAWLHAHHHPIPKSQGGELTVDICPNCHAEFHQIVDHPGFQLTDSGKNLLAKHYYKESA